MVKSMTAYVAALSGDNYDILEEIFLEKFKKFSCLYWLICDYTEYIDELQYNKTDNDILSIDVVMTSKAKKLLEKINKQNEEGVTASCSNKTVSIEIRKNEVVAG